ncbi:MAG: hypothetical protein RLY70_2866 [Planctomycetota bacterium]
MEARSHSATWGIVAQRGGTERGGTGRGTAREWDWNVARQRNGGPVETSFARPLIGLR